jgi:hypothetical protein
MEWFVLTAGLPHMGYYFTHGYDLDGPGAPGPFEFLAALLRELSGSPSEAFAWVVDDEVVENGLWRKSSHCGIPTLGIQSLSHGIVDDTLYYTQHFTGVGLPGTDLEWSVEWSKSGYTHRFEHNRLRVAFADAGAEARFRGVWQQVFEQPPAFAASPP